MGIDTLIESRDASFTLTNATLSDGTDVDAISGFEVADLTGGASWNTIDASAFTGLNPDTNVQTLHGGQGIGTTDGVVVNLTGLTATTPLSVLNNGAGVHVISGTDFRLVLRTGTVVPVDLGAASTLDQVVAAIHAAAPSVTAALDETGTRLVLTDTTAGTGDLRVTAAGSATTAADLGILGTGHGPILVGTPISDGASDIAITLTDGSLVYVDLTDLYTLREIFAAIAAASERLSAGFDAGWTAIVVGDLAPAGGNLSIAARNGSAAAAGLGILGTAVGATLVGTAIAVAQAFLDGGSGNDTITGSPGDDRITGGTGNDTIHGGGGTDTLAEQRDADMTVGAPYTDASSFEVRVGGALVEYELFDGIERVELVGGAGANTIDVTAFAGSATLSTGSGLDTLKGPTTGTTGTTTYEVDVTGLVEPTAGNDTAHQVTVHVGSRPAEIVVLGSGEAVTQADLWWVRVVGDTAATDYSLARRNADCDVGHSFDKVLDVAEDLVFHGRNITLEAGTVNVLGHTLDTSSNAGDGGNITLIGKHITIDDGAVLDTRSTFAGGTSGAITISATEDHAQITALGFVNVDLLDTEIVIGDATIRGGEVTIRALADSTYLVRDGDFGESTIGGLVGTVLGVIEAISVIGGISYTRDTAHVHIGTDATAPTTISADRLDVESRAVAAVANAPIGLNFAVAVTIVKTEAIVTVGNAVIVTTGDAIFRATADHTLNVAGDASNGLITRHIAIGVAVSVLDSTSRVEIQPAARLTIGNHLALQAETVDRNATWGRVIVDPSGAVGIAIAVSVEHGTTTAALDGTATVAGNVTVIAKQRKAPVEANRTYAIPGYFSGVSAKAIVGTPSTGSLLDDLKGQITAAGIAGGKGALGLLTKLVGLIQDAYRGGKMYGPENKPKDQPTQVERSSFQGAFAAAFVDDVNDVTARIGDGVLDDSTHAAHVTAVGTVSVAASITNRPNLTVSASTNYSPAPATTVDGSLTVTGEVKVGVSIAVGVGIYLDDADARIAGNATVDAGRSLTVDAKALNAFDPAKTWAPTSSRRSATAGRRTRRRTGPRSFVVATRSGCRTATRRAACRARCTSSWGRTATRRTSRRRTTRTRCCGRRAAPRT